MAPNARVYRLSRFKFNEVLSVADKDAPKEPRRQESIEFRNEWIVGATREREESDIRQFERPDPQVLRRQGHIRSLLDRKSTRLNSSH